MFGTTLVIVNPTARSGKAAEAAAAVAGTLDRLRAAAPGSLTSATMRYTVAAGDGTTIAREEGSSFDTVLAIGGDGIVNEVVNGLMALPRSSRPRFGLIPCGNGDDFARSLGMEREPRRACEQLEVQALQSTTIDVGQVNGRWFAETLSFGLDAAIALGTTELRQKTNRTGTSLYVQCALDQVINHLVAHSMTISVDGGAPQTIDAYLLAVQNGPSYGGGFKICPDAKLDDGALNLCYATPPVSKAGAVSLFLKAKNGTHTSNRHLTFLTARSLTVDVGAPLPTQVDGEPLPSTHYDIALHPGELDVLRTAR